MRATLEVPSHIRDPSTGALKNSAVWNWEGGYV